MTKKTKKVLLGVAIFILLAAVLLFIWQKSRPETQDGTKHITVEVIHSDGETIEFSYDTTDKYLGELLISKGLISGSESEFGLFVDTVDGEKADFSVNGAWWRLTCNGKDSETGADTTVINDGDKYAWIFTTG